MKKIISRIILILSFAPYVFTLIYGIYSMANGFTFFFSTSYGFEAFRDATLLMMLMLCYIPVIPSCLIYQFVYLSIFIMKKFNVPKNRILLFSAVFTVIIIAVTVFIYINI